MFSGRIVSADSVAFVSVRGMPQCIAMGRVTGTAAALALSNGGTFQSVVHELLVAELTKQGINRLEKITLP